MATRIPLVRHATAHLVRREAPLGVVVAAVATQRLLLRTASPQRALIPQYFVTQRPAPEPGVSEAQRAVVFAALGLSLFGVTPPSDDFEQIYLGLKEGKWDRIKADLPRLIKLTDALGRTLMHRAIGEEEHDIALQLIKEVYAQEISIAELKDAQGNTPLHQTAKVGSTELMSKLLDHVGIDTPNGAGHTPLHLAIIAGDPDSLSFLIDQGASVTQPTTWEGESVTPLALAALEGQVACFEVLQKHEDLSKVRTERGNLLHLLIYKNQLTLLEHVLTAHRAKCDNLLEDRNNEQLTPLALAAVLDNTKIVMSLERHGARIGTPNSNGQTPLHLAVINSCSNDMVKCLHHLGADFSAVDNNLKRPHDVAQDKLKPIVENLSRREHVSHSRPPDFTYRPPQNLVFQGGGPKGIAYVGALRALEAKGALSEVKRTAGTSAGAITAALLSTGWKINDIERFLSETDLRTWFDCTDEMLEAITETGLLEGKVVSPMQLLEATVKSHRLIPKKSPFTSKEVFKALVARAVTVENTLEAVKIAYRGNVTRQLEERAKELVAPLWNCTGLCKGDVFKEWIEAKIAGGTGLAHCTFGELRAEIAKGRPFKHLHVFATRLSTPNEIVQLSSEDPQWDNVVISSAIRASMSIPGAFVPVELDIKVNGKTMPFSVEGKFIDGGVLYNFPIETFDQRQYVEPNAPEAVKLYGVKNPRTLAFSLFTPEGSEAVPKHPETLGDLFLGILGTGLRAEELIRQITPSTEEGRVIRINNQKVRLLDFNLPEEKKQALMAAGEDAADQFYSTQAGSEKERNFGRIRRQFEGTISLPGLLINYVPRLDYTSNLTKALLDQDVSQKCAQYILYGPPGVGKSELAYAFANAHLSDFSLVWVIPSETPESRANAYRKLAQALFLYIEDKDPLDVIVKRVHARLERMDKPWLLIYDNVAKEVPFPERGGAILITARSNTPNILAEQRVDKMSEGQALQLMTKGTREPPSLEMRQLVDRLDYYPLLIHQAAGYIRSTPGMDVTKYLRLVEKRLDFSRMTTDRRYSETLKGMLEIALKSLPKDAVEWLEVCAYLNPDHISQKLLDQFLEHRYPDLSEDVRNRKVEEIGRCVVDQALMNSDQDAFTMHRSFQEVVTELSDQADHGFMEAIKLLSQTGQLVHTAYPFERLTLQQFNEWLANTVVILKNPLFQELESNVQLSFLKDISSAYCLTGRYQEAVRCFSSAISISSDVGKETLEHANFLKGRGRALRGMGEFVRADEDIRNAKKIFKTFHGKAHVTVAACLNSLGVIHYKEKKYDLAFRKFHRAYVIYAKEYGDRDPRLTPFLNNLGSAMKGMGEYKKAEDYFKESIDIFADVHGSKHPQIARRLRRIGLLRLDQHQDQDALSYFNEAQQIFEQASGDHRPEIAKCLLGKAAVFNGLRQHDLAHNTYIEAQEIYNQSLGDRHPRVARCIDGIGCTLLDLGDYNGAILRFEEALEIYKDASYTDQHPKVVQCISNLRLAISMREYHRFASLFSKASTSFP